MTTIDLINYTTDLIFEWNAKVFLLSIICIYLIYIKYKFETKKLNLYVEYIILRLIQGIHFGWFAMFPIVGVGYLFRTMPFDYLYNILIIMFGIGVVSFPLFFLFGGGEFVLRKIFSIFSRESFGRFLKK